MARVYNWRTTLTAHINEHREREFEWGQHDCALWAASCVAQIIGEDFAEKVRGTYSTPEGAYKAILKAYNCHQITEICQKFFGDPIHIAFALPGDIVFRKSNMGGFDAILGICNGKSSIFVQEEGGLGNIPTIELDGAYRV